jgi:hypothetical protein
VRFDSSYFDFIYATHTVSQMFYSSIATFQLNSKSMSLETIITMAISMGRTIVLPPEQPMYLWNKRKHKKKNQKNRFNFHDFYHLKETEEEHPGIKIITMTEFLQQAAKEGFFKDKETGKQLKILSPEVKATWDEVESSELDELYTWLGKNAFHLTGWDSNSCFTFWPNATDKNSTAESRIKDLMHFDPLPSPKKYFDKPVPVNAPTKERMAEQMVSNRKLCHYNETMQNAQILVSTHSWGQSEDEEENGNRFLSPFYTFHFYENWEQALWTKRFVRDHFRYHDELICAAARVVAAIRSRVRSRGLVDNPDDAFNTGKPWSFK